MSNRGMFSWVEAENHYLAPEGSLKIILNILLDDYSIHGPGFLQEEVKNITLENKINWGYCLVGRVLASQAQGPEFNPQHHPTAPLPKKTGNSGTHL